jgi:hypothetical protein
VRYVTRQLNYSFVCFVDLDTITCVLVYVVFAHVLFVIVIDYSICEGEGMLFFPFV